MPFKFDFGGSATPGPPVITYGYFTSSLDITVAALSGGAQVANGTGSLPKRLTTETDKYVVFQALGASRCGIASHPTSGSVFFTSDRNSPRRIWRVDIVAGTSTEFVTGSTTDPTRNFFGAVETLTQGYDNRLWAADQSTQIMGVMIDAVTGRCEKFLFPESPGPVTASHVVEHMPGRILARTSSSTSANYIEYAFGGTGSSNFLTYTGRQLQDSAGFYDCIADLSGNIYTFGTTSTAIIKRSTATLSQSAIYQSPNTVWVIGTGYGTSYRLAAYNPTSQMLHASRGSSALWDMFNVADMSHAGRSFQQMDYGNPPFNNSTVYYRCPVAWSADGSYMGALALIADGGLVGNPGAVRGVRMAPQRARWTWTPVGQNRMIHSIIFDGHHNNTRGFTDSPSTGSDYWLNTEQAFTRTKFFYSFDGGTSRYQFQSGEMLNLNVALTSTLTIDVQFQWNAANHCGYAPYITSGTVVWM